MDFRYRFVKCGLVPFRHWPRLMLAGAITQYGFGDRYHLLVGQTVQCLADRELGDETGPAAGGLALNDGALDGVEVEVERGAAAGVDVGGDEDVFGEVDHGLSPSVVVADGVIAAWDI